MAHLLSPSTPPVPRNFFRSGSPSPTRPRVIDDLISNLSPRSALDVLTSSNTRQRIEASDPTERGFGLNAVDASIKIQDWYYELSKWQWSSQSSFQPPAKRHKASQDVQLQNEEVRGRTGRSAFLSTLAENVPEAEREEEYWGSMVSRDVIRYERRVEEIQENLDALDVEELKHRILQTHLSLSRPSTPILGPSSFLRFPKMDDFTAIVTAAFLKALPFLSKLVRLLDIWTVRLTVLRLVPKLFQAFEENKIALEAAWKSLKLADNDNSPLTRETFTVIRDVLQQKVAALGRKVDRMLDLLEGRQDTIPDSWLDRTESNERQYTEWVFCAQRKVLEGELRHSQEKPVTSLQEEPTTPEIDRNQAPSISIQESTFLEQTQAADEQISHIVDKQDKLTDIDDGPMPRIQTQTPPELSRETSTILSPVAEEDTEPDSEAFVRNIMESIENAETLSQTALEIAASHPGTKESLTPEATSMTDREDSSAFQSTPIELSVGSSDGANEDDIHIVDPLSSTPNSTDTVADPRQQSDDYARTDEAEIEATSHLAQRLDTDDVSTDSSPQPREAVSDIQSETQPSEESRLRRDSEPVQSELSTRFEDASRPSSRQSRSSSISSTSGSYQVRGRPRSGTAASIRAEIYEQANRNSSTSMSHHSSYSSRSASPEIRTSRPSGFVKAAVNFINANEKLSDAQQARQLPGALNNSRRYSAPLFAISPASSPVISRSRESSLGVGERTPLAQRERATSSPSQQTSAAGLSNALTVSHTRDRSRSPNITQTPEKGRNLTPFDDDDNTPSPSGALLGRERSPSIEPSEMSPSVRRANMRLSLLDIQPPNYERALSVESDNFETESNYSLDLSEAPMLDNVDITSLASSTSPIRASQDHFQQQISQVLANVPAKFKLATESEHRRERAEIQARKLRPRPSIQKFPSRAPTPSFTLAPAYAKTSRKPRPQPNNPEIKVYHLSRSNNEAPIKLLVRLVGENGERVMVRVGGGWADLGEYLREYALHHGHKGTPGDKVEVQAPASRVSSVNSIPMRNGRSSSTSESPIDRPHSSLARPNSSLNVRKTRKPTGEDWRDSRSPTTPLSAGTSTLPIYETPPSNLSVPSRSSSRLSWNEDDSALGMAGPKGKKVEISAENQAWVNSMKEKVRQASAEKEKEAQRQFGEMGKVGGTKRLFKRGSQ